MTWNCRAFLNLTQPRKNMHVIRFALVVSCLNVACSIPAFAQTEPIKTLVGRLDLAKYKTTIKGLTQFGDRKQGTDRNRAAVNWIEAQLQSYGCPTERLTYVYDQVPRKYRASDTSSPVIASGEVRTNVGGSRMRGVTGPVGVNVDPEKQTDLALRRLNAQFPVNGSREEVYCTKIGTTHPDEMYIVGGHMDGIGFGEAADDDGSGAALVMELARVFSSPDVQTERSIRFIFWNNEETGLNGSAAYVEQRKELQGKENPPGSGRYPEPKWLGMIQHDMMLFDHGAPREDGTVSKQQRPEADFNIEFQVNSKFAAQSQILAWTLEQA